MMKFGLKITWMAILPILLTTLVATATALYHKSSLEQFFVQEIDRQARSEARKITRNVYLMCRSTQEALQQTVNRNLQVARHIVKSHGSVNFREPNVKWQVRNQYDGSQQEISLPRLYIGSIWPGQNEDFGHPTPVVDDIQNLVGGTVTLFQRMNPRGDMLRVATNVAETDGSRAIGTYIPAVTPEGDADPVVSAILKGNSYQGRAYVVNAWHVTAYLPLWDGDRKNVVGALYVGVRQDNLESLRKGIADIVVGKSGYVYVLGGRGGHRGHYIISQNGSRDGEDIWDSIDADGRYFIREIIEQALRQANPPTGSPIPVEFVNYRWKNPDEDEPRKKVVAVAYFEPWDWVIGAGYYESDLMDSQYRLQAEINNMGYWTGLTAAVMVLLAVPVGYMVAGGIRNRIDSVLTSVEEILIVVDNHGRIMLLSDPAADFLGGTPRHAVKRSFDQVVPYEQLRRKIEECLHDRKVSHRFDFDVPTRKGTRIMEARASSIQARVGGFAGMIFIIHDVTGEREVDRLKSEFICTAAHELSTPLASIIGYSELLLENRDLPEETFREAATFINKKAWSLSRIVNDLLDLTRIELGREIPLEKHPCDLNDILHEAAAFGRNLSRRHQFEVDVPQEPVVLDCDRDKLEQALENIVGNAIKYSPDGGRIRIVGAPKVDGYQIMVEDEGIGMNASEVKHIFDKFYRADSSTTAVEGTGLGMSIVQHIVQEHQGRVWVESRPAKGTRVYIELPWPDGGTPFARGGGQRGT
jgi:PAS domain S-box-containing protein